MIETGHNPLQFNRAQLPSVLFSPKHETQVWGRGTGKSNIMAWKMHRNIIHMPRSSSTITGKTYNQLLTRTLPPTLAFFERMGYIRNQHYFIGVKPPASWGWQMPYESPVKSFDHYLVFGTPKGAVGFSLVSQDREGDGRGLNSDFEFKDEELTIDRDRYDREIAPTNRGNIDHFGHLPFHHGSHSATSMPFSKQGKYILDRGDYYFNEASTRLFEIWNKIVKLQLDLLEINKPIEFTKQWNEIERLRKTMFPFVQQDKQNPENTTLFTFGNAFDNLDNVGLSYIKDNYKRMPRLIFLIEVMNMIVDKVEDCYYQLDTERQVYYDSYNYSHIDSLDYNFKKLGSNNSLFDRDCNPEMPLKIVPDWGANISFLLVKQDNALVEKDGSLTHNIIKEFFVKPEQGRVMIDDVIDYFCEYYQYHRCKTVFFYKDKYGDERQANSSLTYNDQAIKRLQKKGWNVAVVEYAGKEPPHHEKYLMWGNILAEKDPLLPRLRINGNNCKFLIIAMNNTKVIEKDNKFSKDKSSEHKNSGVPQEEATHSTDAIDKIFWIEKINKDKISGTFIPTRL